jgi:hypothetical protein
MPLDLLNSTDQVRNERNFKWHDTVLTHDGSKPWGKQSQNLTNFTKKKTYFSLWARPTYKKRATRSPSSEAQQPYIRGLGTSQRLAALSCFVSGCLVVASVLCNFATPLMTLPTYLMLLSA